jgi:hypothetical protein
LAEKVGGHFLGEGPNIFGNKIVVDLLLVEKRIPGKFGCTGTYCVKMHKEQTNKQTDRQTNILLYIYRLAEVPGVARENLILHV